MGNIWEIKEKLPNRENQRVINEFLLSIRNRGKSKRMIRDYRIVLTNFFRAREELFSSLESTEIQQWLTEYQKKRKECTIQLYRRGLENFYHFCEKSGYLLESPLPKISKYDWDLKNQLPNQENQNIINEFLCKLKENNKHKIVIEGYRGALQRLFKDSKHSFSTLTSDDFENWLSLELKHWKKSSIKCFLNQIRTFYDFCIQKGYTKTNPIPYLRPKEEKFWEIKVHFANQENRERMNEYLVSLYAGNYSKNTIIEYRRTLQFFFKEEERLFSSLQSNDIQKWLIKLQHRCKERTITGRLNVLNSFYKFCVDEGHMDKSPIKSRWFPRLPKSMPKYLNKEEVARVRKQCEAEPLRNRVLIELLLTSGCRLGEITSLDKAQVDLENRTAVVVGKGGKIRQVHFSVRCGLLLERYLESRIDKEPALFVSSVGKPRRLSAKYIQKIVDGIGKRAGLTGSLHPHRLRHTFATNLLEKGAELSFIGDELGHSQLKTTQIYANLPQQKIMTLYRMYMG